jgi:hypothetical protein
LNCAHVDTQQLGDVRGWDAIGHEQHRLAAPQDALLDLIWADRRLDLGALGVGERERFRRPAKVWPVRPVRGVEHAPTPILPEKYGKIFDERN